VLVARLAERREVEAILIASGGFLHRNEVGVAADSKSQVVQFDRLGAVREFAVVGGTGRALDDVKAAKASLEARIASKREGACAGRIAGNRIRAGQDGLKISEDDSKAFEVDRLGVGGYVRVGRGPHETMGHDGDSADDDEIDVGGRQRSQMSLVIGLEGPRGHWRGGFDVSEASIAR
jgi:hypothetical protein